MKSIVLTSLLLATSAINCSIASEIVLAKNITPLLRDKIEKDLNVLENIKFAPTANPNYLEKMGLQTLNSNTATDWLNARVNYIISENALSTFNLLIRRVIYVERSNVDFPFQNIAPYSLTTDSTKSISEVSDGSDSEEGITVMSNIGSALYYAGKKEKKVYGMKISRGLLHRSEKVNVTSPRAGIIQIGEGLFAPALTINKDNIEAYANSIFRLGTFFHEARHGDGNGKSLGFLHATCPAKHDYEGQSACDENLNGPYTIGAFMMFEMAKACNDTTCSAKDSQTLKLMVLDSLNRVLRITHKKEPASNWDATPETL